MERALEAHAHEVCAVIVEPLIQCAGGMRMYHPLYLTMLREACDRHGVHLLADEIAVGFGRTGRMFGCDLAPPPPHDRDAQPGSTPAFLRAEAQPSELQTVMRNSYAVLGLT